VNDKINLNRRQIEFIVYMTEIRDPMEAIKKFASIMVEEKISPTKMPEYVNKLIDRIRGK
jgi:hypothetical protein